MSAVLAPVTELRPMVEADLPSVMAIENAIYPYPWTSGNFRDSLAAGYDCRMYLCDGEPIGYAVLMRASDEAHLLNLSIAADWQGKGYGGLLLQQLCVVARGHGARLFFLEVRPSNAAALRLYERRGFQRIGLRRDYYPAPAGREDALIFGLPL
ncbi:MAG: ribosomal protein S18-alanine N-acetyltransferase [Burkholderiales bacterium]|nr:ribosomal protein S18-alanine N-acetyltransferase [Burkholderiales bacterium]